jgi:hypothetical protein
VTAGALQIHEAAREGSGVRHLHGDELTARDFALRAPARQERDAEARLDRALDPIEAGQRHADVERRAPPLVELEHPVARR